MEWNVSWCHLKNTFLPLSSLLKNSKESWNSCSCQIILLSNARKTKIIKSYRDAEFFRISNSWALISIQLRIWHVVSWNTEDNWWLHLNCQNPLLSLLLTPLLTALFTNTRKVFYSELSKGYIFQVGKAAVLLYAPSIASPFLSHCCFCGQLELQTPKLPPQWSGEPRSEKREPLLLLLKQQRRRHSLLHGTQWAGRRS